MNVTRNTSFHYILIYLHYLQILLGESVLFHNRAILYKVKYNSRKGILHEVARDSDAVRLTHRYV